MAPRKTTITKTARAPRTAPVTAAVATPTIPEFAIDRARMSTRDLLLFQELAQFANLAPSEQNALTLKMAPMLERVIVGGMPDLPIERFGDLITAFFAKLQDAADTKN